MNRASADEIESCLKQETTFDGTAPVQYATVIGPQQSRLYLYKGIPSHGCAATDSNSCKSSSYVIPGNVVAIGKTCGTWAYVQYIGTERITLGWVDTKGLETVTTRSEHDQSDTAQGRDIKRYRFTLKRGKGIPVCEAYLQRINMTTYRDPPYCHWDQPLADNVPGFTTLNKVQLSAQELWPIIGHTYDFLTEQEVDAKKERRRVYGPSGRLISDPDYTESYVEGMLGSETTDAANYHIRAWNYLTPVDIENNAQPERLMIWQGDVLEGTTCHAGWSPDNSALSRIKQYVFVMTPDGSDIDIANTRAIFGHPYGNSVGNLFRPVGDTIGVFRYRDAYYFDTFLREPGDFDNKRKGDKSLFKILDVFQRQHHETRQLCEYVVDDEIPIQ